MDSTVLGIQGSIYNLRASIGYFTAYMVKETKIEVSLVTTNGLFIVRGLRSV